MESRTWRIPSTRMKGGLEHRIPLSSGAIAALEKARELSDGEGFVFPSTRRNTVTAQRTLNRLLKSAGVDCVPHGMRSSFRDWAAECTAFPSEIAEHALAHVEPNKVKAAYLRTDLFDRRVELMQSWSDYLGY